MSDTEDTLRRVVANFEPLYWELQHAVDQIAWFDVDDRTWNNVDAAAAYLKACVKASDLKTPGLTDLDGIDFDTIDFAVFIYEELEQVNVDEDRDAGEGL